MEISLEHIRDKFQINLEEPILVVTARTALYCLLLAIDEFCPGVDINKMTKQEVENLLQDYGDCISNYHPEDSHQERAALLKNSDVLYRCGLTDEEYKSLDFY